MTRAKKGRTAKKQARNKVTERPSKTKEPTKGGRPTKYKPKYVAIAGKLCSEKGYTDENLATHFKVNRATISVWKNKYPDFLDTIRTSKDDFDSREVEQCLLKRCKGYSYVETTRELQTDYDEELDDEGVGPLQTLAVTKKVTKQVVPDVKAQMYWLNNRNSERWKDKKSHEIGGVDGKPIQVNIVDFGGIDDTK